VDVPPLTVAKLTDLFRDLVRVRVRVTLTLILTLTLTL